MTSAAPPPSPPESPEQLLAALRRLLGEGKVELRIDPKPLHHIDSPVALEAEGNLWVYPVPPLVAALWWWQGMAAGLAALAVGVALYVTIGRAFIHRRIERRVREHALDSLDTWRKLWRFQGLTLAAPGRPGPDACASPDGNWMAFVRTLA